MKTVPKPDKYLLHRGSINSIPIVGDRLSSYVENRANEIEKATVGLKDPDISIVIRTKNDIAYIKTLFKDIRGQAFDGSIDIILVDTESSDGTVEFAKSHGAKVISISQNNFTYPKALNLGFQAATNEYVVSIVGHSNLSNRYMFKSLTYWCQNKDFAGVYNVPLPNWNASRLERLAWVIPYFSKRLKKPTIIKKVKLGVMAANSCIIKRSVWEKYGGYNEKYAAGGEDFILARQILNESLLIIQEPLCSVLHSHGLGPINNIRQARHWLQVSKKATAFNVNDVSKRRPDISNRI